jgi:hypothetical protein
MKFKLFSRSKKRTRLKPISCDICLMVYNHVLLHAKRHNLVAQPEESLFQLTATEIAETARRLLPLTTKQQRIALALPSNEFVATNLKLPSAIDVQHIKNAVNFQLANLLPGMTEPLLLAVQPQIQGDQTYAIWLVSKRAEELFQAFNQVGLFLTCILPRPLIALPRTKAASCQVYDEDENSITYLEWSDGVIQQWLHLPKSDCEEADFRQQLEAIVATFTAGLDQERKTTLEDWREQPMPIPSAYNYAMIPPGAVLRMAQVAKRRQQRWLAAAAGLLIIGIMIGFYVATDYERKLQEQLTELRERTGKISQLRGEVEQIEQLIGPIKNLPKQNVVEILEKLDQLIPKNSWIVNFQIEGGVIKVEGYSPEPTKLIEILSNEPAFEDVRHSQGIRREADKPELKFGISCKLKGFDLKSYWLEYFSTKPPK